MTRPRSALVSLDTTPYYHCISRCVRRAYLMGQDSHGNSFDHRKPWVEQRIRHLASVFAIDIAAYAIMENHYHLVLHVDKARAEAWSDDEVQQRWSRLYRGPSILQRKRDGEPLEGFEEAELKHLTAGWRELLHDLSRFMSCLNFSIARRANKEDECTGRFWEGRFKSQALTDEVALVAGMVYVDLNPVRAGIADDLLTADFTSIRRRLRRAAGLDQEHSQAPHLMPFADELPGDGGNAVLPCYFRDYVALVQWYGEARHPRKRGVLAKQRPLLLSRLGLNPRQWDLLSRVIQREASTMLEGLAIAVRLEQKRNHARAA